MTGESNISDWANPIIWSLPVTAFILSLILVRSSFPLLARFGMIDRPNERSSHSRPTLRGGGVAVILSLWMAWVVYLLVAPRTDASAAVTVVLMLMLALSLLSLADDRHGLKVRTRIVAHGVAAAIAVYWLPILPLSGFLPSWGSGLLSWIALVAFLNFFNFMDGINGITGVESVTLGAGVALVAGVASGPALVILPGLLVAGVALGFLRWNWGNARIFLGDSGSVPLGFLLGWLLLALIGAEFSAMAVSAVILPAYYLADAGVTLLRRIFRGEKFWKAHREHFYQKAVQGGRSHAEVASGILVGNICLVGLATLALFYPLMASAGAAFVLVVLFSWMSKSRGGLPPSVIS